ncbi:FAS1 domain-containing protein [Hyaloscypha variabilis F]|uniref:FAS1 domain-containing protein n=1 Tax=Hyaloscypha variabilis (strain UAMH 11265 / GT02V1 / F) TaxID=1149755 RepID=A0A2J6RTC7_HYAVF|nr:FAS1 domain-containing protein [Hyaloscypha variabilis F]
MADFNAQGWLEWLAPLDHDATVLEQQYSESSLRLLSLFPARRDLEHLTVHAILTQSKHSTRLLKILERFPKLLAALDDPASKHTIWAPTDAAFSELDVKRFSSEELEQALQNLIAPHHMPIEHIINMPNVPVLLSPPGLNGSQRIRLRGSPKGLHVNYNAHIIEGNIIAKDGVVHSIDSVFLPPPSISRIVSLLPPSDFSVLQSALEKSGLGPMIEAGDFNGGTLFVPNNSAFSKLGEEINTFLFSEKGASYLRRLIEYHFLPNQTLFSNAYYKPGDTAALQEAQAAPPASTEPDRRYRLLIGTKTFPLPTQMQGRKMSVDISRHGGIIAMRVNGSIPVTAQDGLANNGVVHIVADVLIPPQEPGSVAVEQEDGVATDLKDFISRFEGIV